MRQLVQVEQRRKKAIVAIKINKNIVWWRTMGSKDKRGRPKLQHWRNILEMEYVKETQEYVIMFLVSTKLSIVTKKTVVNLVSLNQFYFLKFTRICCVLSKLTPQVYFQHLLYLIQTHLLLIMWAIVVLEVNMRLQICHLVHMMRIF